MTYICKDCDFLFYRARKVKKCPSCGKKEIVLASKGEILVFQKVLKQAKETIL